MSFWRKTDTAGGQISRSSKSVICSETLAPRNQRTGCPGSARRTIWNGCFGRKPGSKSAPASTFDQKAYRDWTRSEPITSKDFDFPCGNRGGNYPDSRGGYRVLVHWWVCIGEARTGGLHCVDGAHAAL